MKNAEHVLVTINEEGEHEIIFVSNDIKEVKYRAMNYADECFVYSCGVKAYHEALYTVNNVPSRQVETLVRQLPSDESIDELRDILRHSSVSIDYQNKKVREWLARQSA